MSVEKIPAYEPQIIEPKWQKIWLERKQYEAAPVAGKQKFYLLEMLPYPSGDLHVGHARNYTLGDVIARYMRMHGFNIVHPMGWDAFGLPAENAAIERGIHPEAWTESNVENMRRQLRELGVAYDWSREIDTSSPEYYRWTQWLFLLMYRKGLAYKKEAPVNWCPVDKTVLANEQAEGGICWRCGAKVERRNLKQWFLKITDYADRLLEGLDRLDGWPERVKTMQRNWIGRSEGVTFRFAVEGLEDGIDVFTTRLDTVFGVTFVAIAPDHPLVDAIIAGKSEAPRVRAFIDSLKNKSELDRTQLMEKEGVFSGGHALHPLTGERVPIWVTNYVVMTYGTGAVMGVPAHDERDLEFVRKYDLPVKVVVAPDTDLRSPEAATFGRALQSSARALHEAFIDDGVLVDSGEFSGMTSAEAREAIAERFAQRGIGKKTVNYKLRDWLISRQRYWGAPIPFVNCPNHGLVPVPENELPVLLPHDAPFTGQQGCPLEHVPSFMNSTCPLGDGPATREPETMDTFMDSSWYFLRYLSPHDSSAPFDQAAVKYWMPVDHYIGGIEQAVLHLIYARFFYKVLSDEGMVPGDEPFLRLFNQGMVLAEDHEKMSKSRPAYVVGIDDTAKTHGVDALRVFEMFAGPPESDFPWSTTGIAGATRMLSRVWRLVLENGGELRSPEQRPSVARSTVSGQRPSVARSTGDESELRYAVHSRIKQITEELGDRMHVNTSIAAIMSLLNDLEAYAANRSKNVDRSGAAGRDVAFGEGLGALLLLLAPFAPHIAEELWQRTGNEGSIHDQPWPAYDTAALRRDLVPVVVQVNGRRRGVVDLPPGADEDAAFAEAMRVQTVRAQIDGKQIRRRVYVPDKLLNIVVS